MAQQIFISYNRADSDWCSRLYRDLCRRLRSSSIYLAHQTNAPGVTWEPHLWDVLDHSTAFLIVVSPNAVRSDWVKSEVTRALGLVQRDPNRLIIPVLIGQASFAYEIHPDLARSHFADFRDSTQYGETLNRLVYVLRHPERVPRSRDDGSGPQILRPIPLEPFWVRLGRGIYHLYAGDA